MSYRFADRLRHVQRLVGQGDETDARFKTHMPVSAAFVWPRVVLSVALTTVVSLSIHVIMFDAFATPHPTLDHVPGWALLADRCLSAIATIIFYRLAAAHFARLSWWARWLLLSALYMMLNEVLRRYLMGVVVSHDWIFCAVENGAPPIEDLVTCGLIVTVAPRLRTPLAGISGGVAIALFVGLTLDPPIGRLFTELTASLEYLDTGNIYNPPYGWQVDVPSYLTFLEPVIAAFGIAGLALDRLPGRGAVRIIGFACMVMAMKGAIMPTLLYSFYQRMTFSGAVLSESQFGLEILAMAVLTAIGWRWSKAGPAITG